MNFVIEIISYHTNLNLLAFTVDMMLLKESVNSLKSMRKNKFHRSIKICRTQKFLNLFRCIQKTYSVDDFDEIYDVLSTRKIKYQ